MMSDYRTFDQARKNLTAQFKVYSKKIHTRKWQGQDVSLRPDMVSYELLNETMSVDLFGIDKLDHWRTDIRPNLPWADDHFDERVCGAPLNPGTQWANWPWASSADKHRKQQIFNHTYMERLWPRLAGLGKPLTTVNDWEEAVKFMIPDDLKPNYGIRGEYGDLRTLVDMIAWEPDTRQAYIPLYFPEDTGLDGRKPCTLGYQVIMRDNRLHMYYPLRSCDFVRHWADDCYLAVRLLLWIIDECRKVNPRDWDDVTPGKYVMHCTSLHVFANDAIQMGIVK
jgi:hypothetical protein